MIDLIAMPRRGIIAALLCSIGITAAPTARGAEELLKVHSPRPLQAEGTLAAFDAWDAAIRRQAPLAA